MEKPEPIEREIKEGQGLAGEELDGDIAPSRNRNENQGGLADPTALEGQLDSLSGPLGTANNTNADGLVEVATEGQQERPQLQSVQGLPTEQIETTERNSDQALDRSGMADGSEREEGYPDSGDLNTGKAAVAGVDGPVGGVGTQTIGVDDNNPGQGGGGPNAEKTFSSIDDDERSTGGSTDVSSAEDPQGGGSERAAKDHEDRGHGNNADGVDDNNPGQGGGGPNAEKTFSSIDDDERSTGGSTDVSSSEDPQGGGSERAAKDHEDRGHGNNADGVDDNNPGQGGGGPNAEKTFSSIDDDERSTGGSTDVSSSEDPQGGQLDLGAIGDIGSAVLEAERVTGNDRLGDSPEHQELAFFSDDGNSSDAHSLEDLLDGSDARDIAASGNENWLDALDEVAEGQVAQEHLEPLEADASSLADQSSMTGAEAEDQSHVHQS
jgi:hypothetical protein